MRNSCFVIMPYGKKTDVDGKEVDFDAIYKFIIEKAVQKAGLECVRCDDIEFPGSIDESMIDHIFEDRVAIVDISTLNPNVFYELGVRHALKRRVTVLIRSAGTKQPFDIGRLRSIEYTTDLKGGPEAVESIARSIKIALDNKDPKDDSLVYKFVPELVVGKGLDVVSARNYSERLGRAMEEVFCKEPIKVVDEVAKHKLAGRILKDIVDTVHQFLGSRGGRSNGDDLDANYMIAYTRQKLQALPERFRGMVPLEENEWFLVLHDWAHVKPRGHLVLPVGEQGKALLGAPECFASGSPIEVVSDTLDDRYPQGIPPAVRDWAKAYFQKQQRWLRSFASMRINYELEPVGVLNIQSSAVNVLSENKKLQLEI